MSYSGLERRRIPRISPGQSHQLQVETTVPVQVIDISPSGLQLVSKFALAIGDRGELRTSIGSRSVRFPIEVLRVTVENASQRSGARYRAGAVFAPMTTEQRVFLTQILGPEPA